MATCNISNIEDIVLDFQELIQTTPESQRASKFTELFSKYTDDPITMDSLIEGFLDPDLNDDFEEDIKTKYLNKGFLQSIKNSILNKDKFDVSFESHSKAAYLGTEVEQQERQDNREAYLQKFFGADSSSRNLYVSRLTEQIFDYMIADKSDPNKPKFVQTQDAMNNQLRLLQQSLIQDIIKYLENQRQNDRANQLTELLNEFKEGKGLIDIMGKIYTLLSPHFENKELFGLSYLRTIGTKNDPKSDLQTTAFFSYIALFNFDSSLKTILGDSIQIPSGSFDKISEMKKYKITPKSEMSESWRDESQIMDDMDEIGGLTKMLINRLPLWYKQGNTWIKSTDKKLSFKQYANAKIKLNEALTNHELKKITYVDTSEGVSELYKILTHNNSEIEKLRVRQLINDYVVGKSLYDIIANVNDNVMEYAPIALSLFSRTNFFDKLSMEDKQAIISALHGIFDASISDSYINMSLNAKKSEILTGEVSKSLDVTSNNDYFMYCAQMFNSTDKLNNTSYIQDTNDENGEVILKRQRLASRDAKTRSRNLVEIMNGKNNAKQEAFFKHVSYSETEPTNYIKTHFGIDVDLSSFNPETRTLSFSVSDNDHSYQLTIVSNGPKPEVILTDRKDIITEQAAYRTALNYFSSLFNSILPVDTSINSRFFNSYQNARGIFEFAGAVLYRKAVNEKCYTDGITTNKMKEDCNSYLGLTAERGKSNYSTVILRFNTNQLELFHRTLYPAFSVIAQAQDIANGIVGEQMVKDQQGNMRGQVKLSQASCKNEYLWEDSRKKTNAPTSHFFLYDAFEGVDFLIDFKDADGKVHKVTDCNPSEIVASNFMYDFYGNAAQEGIIYAIGPVVSDKPNVMRVGINIDIPISYLPSKPTLRQIINGDSDGKLLKQVWNHEFGEYFRKQFNFVQSQLDLLKVTFFNKLKEKTLVTDIFNFNEQEQAILNEVLILSNEVDIFGNSLSSNYDSFNEYTNNLFDYIQNFYNQLTSKENRTEIENSILQKLSTIVPFINKRAFKEMFLHSLIQSTPNVEFIDNLFGHFEGQDFKSNHLLIDSMIRYNNYLNSLDENYRLKYWNNITSSQAYNDQIFDDYNSRFVSDIIKEDTYLLIDKDNPLFTDKNTNKATKLIKDKKWYREDSNVFALGRLSYNGETTLIATQNDLKSNQLYKDIQGIIHYGLIDEEQLPFDIRSLTIENDIFEFQNLVKLSQFSQFENWLNNLHRIQAINKVFYSLNSKQKDSLWEIMKLTSEEGTLDNNLLKESLRALPVTEVNKLLNQAKIENRIEEPVNVDAEKIKSSFEMNPALFKYNQISMLFNETYTTSIVGSYLNHPFTKNGNESIREMESTAIGARIKRNVSFTATKHQYLLNTLSGISSNIKIAVIQDIDDDVYNLVADGVKSDGNKFTLPKQLSNDGATFVDPAMAYLENLSLQNEAVGVDKKQFGHMLNPNSGTGFILKTAGFALTNDRLRRSPAWKQLLKHMRSEQWLKEGETFNGKSYIDFTKDFYGRDINFSKMSIYFARFGNQLSNGGKPIITHHKLVGIKFNDIGECILQTIQLNNNIKGRNNEGSNNIIEENVGRINSNWDLYTKVLGGEFSESYKKEGQIEKLTYYNDDSSNKNLAILMNLVGVRRKPYIDVFENIIHPAGEFLNTDEAALSQQEARQPLKDALVAYAATEGAVKQGATNVNSNRVYTDPNYKLTTMTLIAKDLGVQLNAEHTVEQTDIAIMTQVMNAAAARGYSVEPGSEIYRILHQIALDSAADALIDVSSNSEGKRQLQEVIADIILKSLRRTNLTDSNILQSIANNIRNFNFTDKSKLDFIREYIPIDNPAILRQIVSKVSIALQRSSVKLRPRGNMDVLVPSNGYVQLYDGKPLDEYGTLELAKAYLSNKQVEREKDPSNYLASASRIRLGRSYKYTDINGLTHLIKVNNPAIYWDLRDQFNSGKINNLIEDITQPRELSEASTYFEGIDETGNRASYQIWDLAVIRERWEIERKIAKLKQLSSQAKTEEGSQLIENSISDLEARKKELLLKLQEQLNIVDFTKNNGIIEVSEGIDENGNVITKQVTIDKDTMVVEPFEAILPKSFKTEFMLTEGDCLSDIINNQSFFLKRFAQLYDSIEVNDDAYDIALIGPNKNIYLAYDGGKQLSEGFKRITDVQYIYEKKHCYRIDPGTSEILYEVPIDANGKVLCDIYTDNEGNEIIRTKNINFFIESSDYVTTKLSSQLTFSNIDDRNNRIASKQKQDQQKLAYQLNHSKDKTLRMLGNSILTGNYDLNNMSLAEIAAEALQEEQDLNYFSKTVDTLVDQFNRDIVSIQDDNENIESFVFKNLTEKSRILHNSFLKSLEVIVSRTPAQCQQSFMSMKAIAFDNSGLNSIMVSRFQLYFQGSK